MDQALIFEAKHTSLESRIVDVDLQVERGQCWHLLGPNGAGKSSLLLMLAGLENPSSGSILCSDTAISSLSLIELAKTRCYLHQNQQYEFDIPLKQLLKFYTQTSSVPIVLDESLDVNRWLHKPLSELSGGQQQRFHIARSLCQIWPAICDGNGIILMDEPTSHLDIKFQTAIMALLQQLSESGNTVVMSSHDINLSLRYASHVGLLNRQKLVNAGVTKKQLTLKNLQSIFEHRFIEINGDSDTQKYVVSASNQTI